MDTQTDRPHYRNTRVKQFSGAAKSVAQMFYFTCNRGLYEGYLRLYLRSAQQSILYAVLSPISTTSISCGLVAQH